MVSYCRGHLAFATLIYSIGHIIIEIRAFFVVLIILLFGFSMSLWLLMRDHHNTPDGCGFALEYDGNVLPNGVEACATSYGDFRWFFAASISLGLFGEPMHEETPIHIFLNSDGTHAVPPIIKTTFFFLFNFMMQVVLLNLIIAIMGEARAHAAEEAAQNAFRRRAELVLEQEENGKRHVRQSVGAAGLAAVGAAETGFRAVVSRVFSVRRGAKEPEAHVKDDRWLHVLVPDEMEETMDARESFKDGHI